MQTSNKKLKKYAGLLNDAAPKGEFLAFINPQEAELLKKNGALGLLTDFGIPSYRGAGGYQGGGGSSSGGSSSGSSSGGGGSSSGGGGGRDSGGGGGGRDYSPPSTPSAPPSKPSTPSTPSAPPGGGGRDSGAEEAARQAAIAQEAARQELAREEASKSISLGTEDIMSGYDDFVSKTYGDGPFISTSDIRTYRLPDGTVEQGSSTTMGRVNEYLESIGQPPVTDVNFDYETEAYSNVGEITDATYDAKTGEVNIEQTPGVVNTEEYQTSSLGAYLDSPDVSEKEKIDTLDRIQALENSNIVGSKLSNLETDFVLGNLTKSLDNIKSDSKYNDLTSKIDVEGKTLAKDFQDAPIETFLKSGGILGSIIRSGYDQYKNNQVLELLGYTGKTIKYNPDGSGDFNYTGYPTVNVGRDEVNTLAPMAPYAVQNTTPLPSVAQKYFDELPQGSGLSFQAAYDAAKTKVNQTLGNPSAMGLLAVNESPFYDFLKIRGLDRRIL